MDPLSRMGGAVALVAAAGVLRFARAGSRCAGRDD